MSMLVYLNGQWLPSDKATVSVEDRGFMFGDGIYEVVRYYNQRPIAMAEHAQRLERNLAAIRIELPADHPGFDQLSDELLRRNNMPDAAVYWQVTRGAAPRKHPFPPAGTKPTVLVMAYPAPAFVHDAPTPVLRAITRPDIRWQRCSIKAITLLPNVLDTQAAVDQGCHEAVLVRDDGTVTEGTARSIYIAEKDVLYTHPLDGRILDSITRSIFNRLAAEAGCEVREEYFTSERLHSADEIIAVGTTTEVASILELDGRAVGDGKPGPIATQMFKAFRHWVAQQCCIE